MFFPAFPRRRKRFIFGVLETWMMLIKQEARRAHIGTNDCMYEMET